MARLGPRLGILLLGAALLSACGGGQTGQPDSGSACAEVTREADDAWGEATVSAATDGFVGSYDVDLRWREEPLGPQTGTPVQLEDSAELTLGYARIAARESCDHTLRVPISVRFATSASSVAEAGEGELTFGEASGTRRAVLAFEGTRVRLLATLNASAGGARLEGTAAALDSTLPGAVATFAAP